MSTLTLKDQQLNDKIEDITKNIKQLESSFNDNAYTETVRSKLKNCLIQINLVLGEISEQKNSTYWNEQKKRSVSDLLNEKKHSLESRAESDEYDRQRGKNSGIKRRDREHPEASDVFGADNDGRQYKKPKSVGRNNPYNNIQQNNTKYQFEIGDNNSSSSYSGSESYSSSESGGGFPSLPPLPGLDSGVDLLGKLNNLALRESSSSESGSSWSSSGSTSESDEKPPPAKKAPAAFDVSNTSELLATLSSFKRATPSTDSSTVTTINRNTSRSAGGGGGAITRKQSTKSTSSSSKGSVKKKEEKKEDKKEEKKEEKKEDKKEEEEMFDLSLIKGGGKIRGAPAGGGTGVSSGVGGRRMKVVPTVPSKEKSSSSSSKITIPSSSNQTPSITSPKSASSSSYKSMRVKKPSSVGGIGIGAGAGASSGGGVGDLQNLLCDEGGSNTFQLFMKMNEFKNKGAVQIPDEDTEEEQASQAVEEKDPDPEIFDSLELEYGTKEDTNKDGMKRGKKGNMLVSRKNRYQMEDTHVICFPFSEKNKEQALFCVFDGHAGKGCATELITLFPQVFFKHWNSGDWGNKTDLTELWEIVYKEVDEALLKYEDEGATATTVLIWRNPETGKRYLQSANIGDSASVLRRNGKGIQLSEDHKPTMSKERERIAKMGIKLGTGQTRLNGLAVSRAFGNHFPKSQNIGMISTPFVSRSYCLSKKDTRLIVASDGLWDVVPAGDRVFRLIKEVKDAQDAAEKLCNTATKSRKCHDNVTVLVVNLRPEKKSNNNEKKKDEKKIDKDKKDKVDKDPVQKSARGEKK